MSVASASFSLGVRVLADSVAKSALGVGVCGGKEKWGFTRDNERENDEWREEDEEETEDKEGEGEEETEL